MGFVLETPLDLNSADKLVALAVNTARFEPQSATKLTSFALMLTVGNTQPGGLSYYPVNSRDSRGLVEVFKFALQSG